MKERITDAARGALGQAALIGGAWAAVWLAYYPSLGHGPRADQWCYLLDTVDQHQFFPLLSHTYSYSRTRMICPGDYHLFRPVLFALLSGEKALFGNNFALWQAAGILLHCFAMYLLLHLLFQVIRYSSDGTPVVGEKPYLSRKRMLQAVYFALVLFFGLNCAVVEMVIWSHINGYILFVILVLGSILLLLEGIAQREASPQKRGWLLGAAWFMALISAFTYEIGQLYAVIAGMVASAALHKKGQARRSAVIFGAFLSILFLYRLVNLLDQRLHSDRAPDIAVATILGQMASRTTIANAGRYLLYDAVQPFFPCCVDWMFGSRLNIPEAAAARWHDWKGSPTLIVSYVVLGGMAGLTIIGLRRLWAAKTKRVGLIVALPAFGLFSLHMGITVFGRMNVRPRPDILSNNSYYTYIPFLFLLLGLSATWAVLTSDRSPARSKLMNGLGALVFVGLAILSIAGLVKVHAINVKGCDEFARLIRQVAWVERFIQHHRDEADFSLAFEQDSCTAVGTQYGVPITTILFKRYLNSSCPKYLICFSEGEPSSMTYNEWQASRSPHSHLCPELVAVGTSYNFYFHEGWYYGVLHWDGCYDPSRCDHAYLIKGPTLEKARNQYWFKLAEASVDIRAGRFIPPETSVTLLKESYLGFNLIESNGTVYAVADAGGSFDLDKIQRHGCRPQFRGSTLESVYEQIRAFRRRDSEAKSTPHRAGPAR